MQPITAPADHAATLPPPAPRKHIHTRTVVFRGYRREDGLWDIEGQVNDAKTYAFDHTERGRLEPGSPVHGMAIRLTVDDAMKITDVAVTMPATPFPECQASKSPLAAVIGHSLAGGWRKTIEQTMGGIRGCTHLRELLFNMATAAYQTIPLYREHMRRLAGTPAAKQTRPQPHLGTCLAWDFDGPVVKRHRPQWFGWRKPTK